MKQLPDFSTKDRIDIFDEVYSRMIEAEARVAELEALRSDTYRMMQSVRDEIPEQAYTAIIVIVPEWVSVWDRVQS